jgi:hypothetical protein
LSRKDFSELNGAHVQLVYALWKKVLLPAISDCDSFVVITLQKLLHEWEEIQWIFYSLPTARLIKELRLRLHILTFRHLYLCKYLFPDISKHPTKRQKCQQLKPSTITAADYTVITVANLRAWISQLNASIGCNLSDKAQKLNECQDKSAQLAGRVNFSRADKELLWDIFIDLKKSAPVSELSALDETTSPTVNLQTSQSSSSEVEMNIPDTTQQKVGQTRKRSNAEIKLKTDTIMSVYLHTIIAHAALFFEKLDFCNVCTEREEAFFSAVKNIVNQCSNKNLETAQPIREILIRHHFKAEALELLKDEDNQTLDKISKAFKRHTFEEMEVHIMGSKGWEDPSCCYAPLEEINALIQTLTTCGYSEQEDWIFIEAQQKYVFTTKTGTLTAFNLHYANVGHNHDEQDADIVEENIEQNDRMNS